MILGQSVELREERSLDWRRGTVSEPLCLFYNACKKDGCGLERSVQLVAIAATTLDRQTPVRGRKRYIKW